MAGMKNAGLRGDQGPGGIPANRKRLGIKRYDPVRDGVVAGQLIISRRETAACGTLPTGSGQLNDESLGSGDPR